MSEQIKALEKEYQRALLIRTTRSVKLTPQGEHVLSCMGNIKSTLLELERTLAHEPRGDCRQHQNYRAEPIYQ
ncbi:LysR family transcriptional regulator [Pseudoalteromonas espejiana]